MKNLEMWVTFVASVPHDRSENLRWKFLHIFIIIIGVREGILLGGGKNLPWK